MSRSAALSILAALAAFLAIWQLVVIVSGFPPFILPAPGAVLARWATAFGSGLLTPHLVATLQGAGYACANAAA